MTDDSQEYAGLLALEDLESLLEELEELGARDSLDSGTLPGDLSERVRSLDLHSLADLRSRIAALHSKLDVQDQA